MKIKKFLSVALDILDGNKQQPYNKDELYDYIKEIKGNLQKSKIDDITIKKNFYGLKGKLKIRVNDENGIGMSSMMKIFPMSKEDEVESFVTKEGKIDFIVAHTNFYGNLDMELSVGRYFLEVSRGSEYEVYNTDIYIVENQLSVNEIILERLVNLQEINWYAGDLHHHSIYSKNDGKQTPDEVCNAMMAKGLSFGALSDHHNILNHNEWQKTKQEGFMPIISKEISTTNGHVMSLNVPKDVIYAIPKPEDRTLSYLKKEFIRVTDEIKLHGGLAQINHPKDLSKSLSVSDDMIDSIDIFDTMEIWNGSNPMVEGSTNYKAVELWVSLLNKGIYIPATSGSDTHNIKVDDYHDILNQLTQLVDDITDNKDKISKEMLDHANYFAKLYHKTMPSLKKWVETSLGTACVRTYVYIPGDVQPNTVLKALKQGNSFLTNGPILIPSINGKIPGETVNNQEHTVDIDITLKSNKPIKAINIYGDGKLIDEIQLISDNSEGKMFDYSRKVKNIKIDGVNWIIFIAHSDCTNLAISNPIFINKV